MASRTREAVKKAFDATAPRPTSQAILVKSPQTILLRIAGVLEQDLLQAVPPQAIENRQTVPGFKCLEQEQKVFLDVLLEDLRSQGYGFIGGGSHADVKVIILAFNNDKALWKPVPEILVPLLKQRAQFMTVYANECVTTGERLDTINVSGLHQPNSKKRQESQQLTFDGNYYDLVPLVVPGTQAVA